jgi:type IV pilus assembly protein PilB
VAKTRRRLGEILREAGLITDLQLAELLEVQSETSLKLGQVIVQEGLASEADIASALSTQLGIPTIDLRITEVEPVALEAVPEHLVRRHLIMPLSVDRSHLVVAMADPLDFLAVNDVQFASGHRVSFRIATPSDIQWAIETHYRIDVSIESIVEDIGRQTAIEILQEERDGQAEISDLKKQSEAAPIIRMVNTIITSAVEANASDIHVEPQRKVVMVRHRVDGHLRRSYELPKWVQGAVISRIKIMAQLDITEKRLPQDGRITVRMMDRALDLRVSTLPTNYGEKIVIRLLESELGPVNVERLGMDPETRRRFLGLVERPQGILLVTGPTGSGKTTTLYAALSHINSVDRNITTVEDPVEYKLDGISQVQTDERAGRTFSGVLRALLRQDPDVIMVGEMRDVETSTIAMQASLTGHLVLSTVHTNSTVATLTRLRNLGLPPYLIASTINGVVAQRLVRTTCTHCKVADTPEGQDLERLDLAHVQVPDAKYVRGQGCAKCGGTGFRGRTAVYEILTLSRTIREKIVAGASEAELKKIGVSEGMRTLAQDGLQKVLAGITTVAELARVIQVDEEVGGLCRGCQQLLSPDFIACPSCGTEVRSSCRACQATVDPEWDFCPYCVAELPRRAVA